MVLNQANNIMTGNTEVQKVYLGDRLIWERRNPEKITLTELDELFKPTRNLEYFDTIAETNTYLKNHSSINYVLFIGRNMGLTELNANAFQNRTNLIDIEIPESIVRIGNNAFEGCSGLRSVRIQGAVTEIEKYTFNQCSALTDIHLPETVTSIGDFAFYQCGSLEYLDVPESVGYIGSSAFSQSGIKRIALHHDALTLKANAFNGSNLESASVRYAETVGDNVFRQCTALTDVYYDGTDVSQSMFYDCKALRSVTLGGHVINIRSYAFRKCEALPSISFPDSVETISSDVLYDCTALTSVSIGNGIQSIHQYAFRHTTALTSFTISVAEDSVSNYPWSVSHKEIISWTG